MRRLLDVKTPRPGGARGAWGTALSALNPDIPGAGFCQCRINPSGCLVCRGWSRRIRAHQLRRAAAGRA